jgi:hypothetical protein
MPGRVIPDPSASGFVQASVSGRLSAQEGGFPRLGASVKAGDLLAFVTPPFQAIDVSDMRQKAGELEQQISIVERRIARYEMLIKTGAITKVALDEAELELKGLKERRSSLDKVRAEPERLVAPVSGVIAAANAVAGQIAETNAIIFQIVDPAHLWVEALTFSDLPDAKLATAITGEGRELTLSFQGAGHGSQPSHPGALCHHQQRQGVAGGPTSHRAGTDGRTSQWSRPATRQRAAHQQWANDCLRAYRRRTLRGSSCPQ